jgi:hypothetical protein
VTIRDNIAVGEPGHAAHHNQLASEANARKAAAQALETRVNAAEAAVVAKASAADVTAALEAERASERAHASGTFVQVVNAGTDLAAPRPPAAASVLWRFAAGVDVGTNGAAVVNGQPGDLFFVASA